MSEIESSGRARLQASTTVKEVLDIATGFEKAARDFYTDLIPKVSKNIRWLVEELAQEEQRHYELFAELAGRADIAEQVNQRIEKPASDGKFSDAVHVPDLGDKPDDQTVLQYALGREDTAMKQYHALAASTEPGPIHDLFQFLANEETEHKAELEKLYYEIVHAGGV
ncbi:MAG: ferritin family protein [Gammaproteobacteria bacterium]|nr:ferritin family protein [Gammaproteobacteria bacterium]